MFITYIYIYIYIHVYIYIYIYIERERDNSYNSDYISLFGLLAAGPRGSLSVCRGTLPARVRPWLFPAPASHAGCGDGFEGLLPAEELAFLGPQALPLRKPGASGGRALRRRSPRSCRRSSSSWPQSVSPYLAVPGHIRRIETRATKLRYQACEQSHVLPACDRGSFNRNAW